MSQIPRCFVVLAAIALTSASQSEKPGKQETAPAERKAIDTVLFSVLRDVINRGVDLYNAGDTAACYRVYEGSLTTVHPLLEHRPDLQKVITRSLASADRDPLAWRRAFTLRDALDKVRAGLNPKKKRKDVKPPLTTEKRKKSDNKKAEKLPPPRVEEEKQGGKDL